jgi:hypothetical protein
MGHQNVDSSLQNCAVVSLDVSFDGKWLAAARFSHGKGSVQVFSLETFECWWSIPEMEATTTCIKFLGGGALAVGCANNSFYIYNIHEKTLSSWSHDMGVPILKSLPKELSSRSEPLTRILSTPSLHQKLVLVRHSLSNISTLSTFKLIQYFLNGSREHMAFSVLLIWIDLYQTSQTHFH